MADAKWNTPLARALLRLPALYSSQAADIFLRCRAEGGSFSGSLLFAHLKASAHVPQACSGPRGYADWSCRDSGAVW